MMTNFQINFKIINQMPLHLLSVTPLSSSIFLSLWEENKVIYWTVYLLLILMLMLNHNVWQHFIAWEILIQIEYYFDRVHIFNFPRRNPIRILWCIFFYMYSSQHFKTSIMALTLQPPQNKIKQGSPKKMFIYYLY